MDHELYVDGGVVSKNPSPIGGTYAYRLLKNGEVVSEGGFFISCADARVKEISNNITEMMALVKGLENLPDDWTGTILSDSMITIGRAFSGWKWKNIPDWLIYRFRIQRARLVNWNDIGYGFLAGHPTKTELAAGEKRGLPVSIHNVWCDHAARKAGEKAVKSTNVPIAS